MVTGFDEENDPLSARIHNVWNYFLEHQPDIVRRRDQEPWKNFIADVTSLADEVSLSENPEVILDYSKLLFVAGYHTGGLKAIHAALEKSQDPIDYGYAIQVLQTFQNAGVFHPESNYSVALSEDRCIIGSISTFRYHWAKQGATRFPTDAEMQLHYAKCADEEENGRLDRDKEVASALEAALTYAPDDFEVNTFAAYVWKQEPKGRNHLQTAVSQITLTDPKEEDFAYLLEAAVFQGLEHIEQEVFEVWTQKDTGLTPLLGRAKMHQCHDPRRSALYYGKVLEIDPKNLEARSGIAYAQRCIAEKDPQHFLM